MFRILIAENGGVNLKTISKLTLWQDCGFEISGYVSNTADILAASVQHQFDMLICINKTGSVIGATLLKQMQQKNCTIPTVVISQCSDPQDMRECFLLGAVDYLVEPVNEDALRNALLRTAKLLNAQLMNSEYLKALEMVMQPLSETCNNEAILEKLRDFMISMQDSTATAENAADYFGFNRDYFGRYFKNKTGVSFTGFYKDFMIEYAKLLLSSGQYKVYDVSRILGFSSTDYFTRVFKKRTGQKPSDYKKS